MENNCEISLNCTLQKVFLNYSRKSKGLCEPINWKRERNKLRSFSVRSLLWQQFLVTLIFHLNDNITKKTLKRMNLIPSVTSI